MATADHEVTKQSWNSIGLALSGGGFRATFFHLGVLRALREASLLQRVTFIASVSGGSILAAHVVQNWEKYSSSDDDFDKIVGELIGFVDGDLRGHVLRGWILTWLLLPTRFFPRFKLINLLKQGYEGLYHRGQLGALNPSRENRPNLQILATSLTTGELCSFDYRGFRPIDRNNSNSGLIRYSDLPISMAVAASSAFPPLFPPLKLTKKILDDPSLEIEHSLCDGGVYDNLGLQTILDSFSKDNAVFDTAIVSDAEGAWGKSDRRYTWPLSRNVRASELLMRRVSILQYELMSKHKGHLRVGIDQDFSEPAGSGDRHEREKDILKDPILRQLPRLRTDLNKFSEVEIYALVTQGYTVTRHLLRAQGVWKEGQETRWKLMDPPILATARAIRKGAKRRYLRGSWRDKSTYMILALCSIYIWAASSFITSRRFYREQSIESNNRLNAATLGTREIVAVSPSRDALRVLNSLNPPESYEQISSDALKQVEPSILKNGTFATTLTDSFTDAAHSSFRFADNHVLGWAEPNVDISVVNGGKEPSRAAGLLLGPVPGIPVSRDTKNSSGIYNVLYAPSLEGVNQCPDDGYVTGYFSPIENSIYCVRTADGQHYARVQVLSITPTAITFAWKFPIPVGPPELALPRKFPPIELTTSMAIDVDGAPNAYGPKDKPTLDFELNAHVGARASGKIVGYRTLNNDGVTPIVQGLRDPFPGYFISSTSFENLAIEETAAKPADPRRYVDASKINYVVRGSFAVQHGVRLGDFVAVFSKPKNKSVYAIVGDDGNSSGAEGSLALLRALGYPFTSGKTGGVSGKDIVIRYFPGSNPARHFFYSQDALDAEATQLGLDKTFGSPTPQRQPPR